MARTQKFCLLYPVFIHSNGVLGTLYTFGSSPMLHRGKMLRIKQKESQSKEILKKIV